MYTAMGIYLVCTESICVALIGKDISLSGRKQSDNAVLVTADLLQLTACFDGLI